MTAFDMLFSHTATTVTTTAVFYVQGLLRVQSMVIENHNLSWRSKYCLPLSLGLAGSNGVCTWDFVLRRDVKQRQQKQLRDNAQSALDRTDIDSRVRSLLQSSLDQLQIVKNKKHRSTLSMPTCLTGLKCSPRSDLQAQMLKAKPDTMQPISPGCAHGRGCEQWKELDEMGRAGTDIIEHLHLNPGQMLLQGPGPSSAKSCC
ncbi:hypothetical protein CABS01_16491 [Colletotrichum abscissum]|uniref:uncharacterized protein n=1 Tax=Colletotrichum abscissum TaxID=1671311 RepID=UPI0027D487C8|nr:uncharacterized protein CABS01_16491 [Colletotrichum abscissum]KAK1521610.1 hypothetical protein CABS01_16491 [Colletotrichum abscissum]